MNVVCILDIMGRKKKEIMEICTFRVEISEKIRFTTLTCIFALPMNERNRSANLATCRKNIE